MRQFDYSALPDGLLTQETMDLLAAVHEHKGRQELHMSAKPAVLDSLANVARAQSTDASNRIEGIHTSEKRLRKIMEDEGTLEFRDEDG